MDPSWDLCPTCLRLQEADRVVGWLIFVAGPFHGQTLKLYPEANTVGSGAACGIILPDPRVSMRHCTIDCQAAQPLLIDLSSASGTYVNHRRVERSQKLVDYDRIRVGRTVLKFRAA